MERYISSKDALPPSEKAIQICERLKKMGAKIGIDYIPEYVLVNEYHMGIGYASINRQIGYKVEYKLDNPMQELVSSSDDKIDEVRQKLIKVVGPQLEVFRYLGGVVDTASEPGVYHQQNVVDELVKKYKLSQFIRSGFILGGGAEGDIALQYEGIDKLATLLAFYEKYNIPFSPIRMSEMQVTGIKTDSFDQFLCTTIVNNRKTPDSLFKIAQQFKLDIAKRATVQQTIRGLYQKKFREIIYNPHIGTQEAQVIEHLGSITGIPLQIDKNFAYDLYETFLRENSVDKFPIVSQLTGFEPDREFIQEKILKNKKISMPTSFTITSEELDAHFATVENRTLAEYKRVYTIFGCYNYYQNILVNLAQDATLSSRQQMIGMLAAIGLNEIEPSEFRKAKINVDIREQYEQIRDRIFSYAKEGNNGVNKYVASAIAEFAKNGDESIIPLFVDVIRTRASGREQVGIKGKLGLTGEQELALRTLMQLDNATANEALFSLLFAQDLDGRVKRIVLNNLLTKERFFPKKTRAILREQLTAKGSEFSFDDLKFYQVILKIPSQDVRKKSIHAYDDAVGIFDQQNEDSFATFYSLCPSVPENTFTQLYAFANGNRDLLVKFNGLYEQTKGSAQQEALLVGIVNAYSIKDASVREKVVSRLRDITFTSPAEMASLLKTIAFLGSVQEQLQHGYHDNEYYGNDDDGEDNEGYYEEEKKEASEELDIAALLDEDVESVTQLNTQLKKVVAAQIQKVLPSENITAEKIEDLWSEWGNLEPLFVYAGKMKQNGNRGTLNLVAAMVPHMDAPEYTDWKEWRYDLTDATARRQVGHLTPEQREVWATDHFAELGDVMIAVSPTDRPAQIVHHIQNTLSEGHIYNQAMGTSEKYKFIQDSLQHTYNSATEQPEQRDAIMGREIKTLQDDMAIIDSITRFAQRDRMQQTLTMFTESQTVPVNKKTGDAITFLAQFLSKEQVSAMQGAYAHAERTGSATAEGLALFPPEIRQALEQKFQAIESGYTTAIASDIFDRYGLDKEQVKNIGQFYQKRQELKALQDLYRLGVLTSKLIATNRISEREDKGGETISQVIEGLRKYFKDNAAFLQDIDNMQAAIVQKEDLGANRRLAMLITDNPQMLFQVGKYPIGCGSCQNYEGSPDWNKALAGYVADAHTKATFLIDLNKLAPSVRQDIETRGFEEVKDTIAPQDLLEASVGRSVMKIVTLADGTPVLFIEPTYTTINKGDLSMNKYFDVFAELMVTNPMDIRLVRGAGDETVRVPASRNPSGQYEDAAAGDAGNAGMGIQTGSYEMSARFIDKFSPVTEADRVLAERISSGSYN